MDGRYGDDRYRNYERNGPPFVERTRSIPYEGPHYHGYSRGPPMSNPHYQRSSSREYEPPAPPPRPRIERRDVPIEQMARIVKAQNDVSPPFEICPPPNDTIDKYWD